MSEEKDTFEVPVVDAMHDKANRPDWWPADYEGYWSDEKECWVEPEPQNEGDSFVPEEEEPVEQKEPDV